MARNYASSFGGASWVHGTIRQWFPASIVFMGHLSTYLYINPVENVFILLAGGLGVVQI